MFVLTCSHSWAEEGELAEIWAGFSFACWSASSSLSPIRDVSSDVRRLVKHPHTLCKCLHKERINYLGFKWPVTAKLLSVVSVDAASLFASS